MVRFTHSTAFALLALATRAVAVANETIYDHVIISSLVGGGTAGLALAARLTEDASKTVLVLEAGGTGKGNANITDLRNRYLPFDTPVDWAIDTVPQTAANDRVYTQRQGKVLGGSSAISGAVYLRPALEEFAVWEALGAQGWTFDRFQEYAKKSENFTPAHDPIVPGLNESDHGHGGPIQVSVADGISTFFAEYAYPTLANLSETINPDNSDGTPVGATPQEISIWPGTYNRSYSANSYYWPNQDRTNLVVLTDSPVEKILWSNDTSSSIVTATGVQFLDASGQVQTVNAKNVVLSAGALHTPQILELSGIGDQDILKTIGVEPVVSLPGVGKNLQNQLGVNVIYTLKPDSFILGNETQAPLIDLIPATKVLSAADLEHSTQMLQTKNDGISQKQFDALKKFIDDGVAQTEMNWSIFNKSGEVTLQFYTTVLHTFSRGYVHANSTNISTPVTLNPNYLSAEHDLWYLSRSVAYTRNITSTPPLSLIVESEQTPGANYTTTEDLQDWLLPNFKTMSHFVGSAAALPKEDDGVVDPSTLVVYGTSNVRVVDASVVPLIPGIHTQSITYAIAEWAADLIKSGSS